MNHYLKSLWIATAILLSSIQSWASDVDASSAQNLASRFIASQRACRMNAPGALNLRLSHTEPSAARSGSVAYYVFNDDGGKAFVIVAGDDRGEQILAYGDHAFDMNHIPANVQSWLNEYKAQIEWLATHEDNSPARMAPQRQQAPTREAGRIAPMVTSRWNQGEPYYNQCPEYNGELCATGCVATAMAQVMYYWKYPSEMPPLPGYVSTYMGIVLPDLPGTQLDWDNMLDDYYNNYTPVQADAVSTLMRYCGQGCFMEYSPDGSGSSELTQLVAMVAFGYNRDAECLYRDEINDDERWNSLLLEDLSLGRPILYCGSGQNGGHAFILDGYADGMYHVNWGWGGYYDGYYALDALGNSNWSFEFNHNMLYHLYPDKDSSTTPMYDVEQAGIYYKHDGDALQVTRRDVGMNSYSGEVVIPESVTWEGKSYPVTSIERGAFANCLNVTSVSIPASVKNIGDAAFLNCRELSTVRIYGTDKTIGNYAFYDCWKLNSLYVDDVVSWCGIDLESFYSNPMYLGASLYDQGGHALQDIVIPASVNRIDDYAFICCPNLHSVTIEEGVKSIGEFAFFYCESLASVSLPGSLRYMGESAFCESGIKSLVLAEGITSIGEMAFLECNGLTHVDVPNSVTVMGYGAFAFCNGLKSINLGSGLTYLDHYTLYSCPALERVTVPNSVTSMGYGVFYGDVALSSVTLSDQLDGIPGLTFSGCSSLSGIDLPQGITYIGQEAFASAKSLTGISIPKHVTSIEASAFKNCTKLQRVDISDLESWLGITFGDQNSNPLYTANHLCVDGEEISDLVIPDGVTAIKDHAFYRCYSVTSITMGDGVKSIGNNAFNGCKNVKSVKVGDGVRRIGEKAFASCSSLTDFTFGSRVDSVGMQAFASCNSLKTITSWAVTPPSMKGTTTFTDKAYSRATVYVPRQSLEAYRQALVWKRFAQMEGFNTTWILADVNGDGEVNIADVNAVIDLVLAGSRSLHGDVNGDGEVNVADINAVIDAIIEGA